MREMNRGIEKGRWRELYLPCVAAFHQIWLPSTRFHQIEPIGHWSSEKRARRTCGASPLPPITWAPGYT